MALGLLINVDAFNGIIVQIKLYVVAFRCSRQLLSDTRAAGNTGMYMNVC